MLKQDKYRINFVWRHESPQHAQDMFDKAATTLYCSVRVADQTPPDYSEKPSIDWPQATQLVPLKGTPLQLVCVPKAVFTSLNEYDGSNWSKQFTYSLLNNANLQGEIKVKSVDKHLQHYGIELIMPQLKVPCLVSCQTVERQSDSASNWQCKW